ncbi:hypothetical protein [Spongiivirga citrea]|uniref:Uncharacterized protein n=1 Tax=Spongiivirga citrea TaxID=1481457 RepID=A0A6M0CNM6_9FLAO|nr:hypothetical protein [Spongiivirga citrea]NER17644.1 hypothetical protein [Spongiivirga citrea]
MKQSESDNLDKLKMDYQYTVNYIFRLSDIRFKLLGLLPLATGIAFAFIDENQSPVTSLILGVFGFLITIGILFYDLRNTEIYNQLIHRAKALEQQIDFPKAQANETNGGIFGNRSSRNIKFLGLFSIWHDKALAIIYSTVCWVWLFVVFASSLSLLHINILIYTPLSLGLAAFLALILYRHLIDLDKEK